VSYVIIQVIWLLCVLITPPALVTVANGLHMIFFRYEYNSVLRRAMRILPYAEYLTPLRDDPKYFLPLGAAYTLFGVASVVLLIVA
jgi:hypothetical protein